MPTLPRKHSRSSPPRRSTLDPTSCDDPTFDALYPPAIGRISSSFWTPVDVARSAARLFQQVGVRRVLDVGAGVGKFALIAAAAAPKIRFVGVEQREHLVDIARRTRARLKTVNVRFFYSDVTTIPWRSYDGFYFFNPFVENLLADDECIDDRVELTEARFIRDVLRIERGLRQAALGTAVVTYHGWGGRIPASYELEHLERAGADWLRLWIKRRETDNGAFLAEHEYGVRNAPPTR